MRNNLFLILIDVILDDVIACVDDVRFAAVIDLQFEHLDIRSVSFYVQKVLHHRSSSAVDALEIISDHRDVRSITRQHSHQFKLDPIGVLRFVD